MPAIINIESTRDVCTVIPEAGLNPTKRRFSAMTMSAYFASIRAAYAVAYIRPDGRLVAGFDDDDGTFQVSLKSHPETAHTLARFQAFTSDNRHAAEHQLGEQHRITTDSSGVVWSREKGRRAFDLTRKRGGTLASMTEFILKSCEKRLFVPMEPAERLIDPLQMPIE